MNPSLIIYNWKRQNKLKTKDARLLLEAYRRFFMFHKNKPISQAWLGLGFREYDHSPFFIPVHRQRTPRTMAWYKLNESGLSLISKLITLLPWRKEYSLPIFEGKLI